MGRAWVYGDDVNTDVIFPGKYTYTIKDEAEMAQHALEDLDPKFAGEVRPGDVIVAGRNWGCGSSREQAVTCLRSAGIRIIIAKSFARIYFRNAVNNGLLPVICPEAVAAIQPGEPVTVDADRCTVRCAAGEFPFPPLSPSVTAILHAGGLLPMLAGPRGFARDSRRVTQRRCKMTTICLIPGDGVGREVIPAAAQAVATALPGVRFVTAQAGWDCFVRCGNALPEETIRAVAAADATLFGATQSPTTGARNAAEALNNGKPSVYRSPILALRKTFDLYANLRPAAPLLPGTRSVDLLIVRENTEGLYSGRERRDGDTAIAERVITRGASERIARAAFEQARRRAVLRGVSHSPRVTVVHKANVLKITDGLFRESCLAIARQYPDIEIDEMLIDSAAMWLVRDPSRFDVIVTTNLFGDILSDLAAGLVGGLGIAPSANVGAGKPAVFEPVHGSAPDIVGRGIANPVGALLSAAMMLEHIGEGSAATAMRQAVRATAKSGLTTPDLGGMATTAQVTAAVCDILRAMAARGELGYSANLSLQRGT